METETITKADLELLGEDYIKGLEINYQKGFFPDQELPLDFKFNCDWKLSFKCTCCDGKIILGENLNIPEKYFFRFQPLMTSNYSLELLNVLANAVSDAEVIFNKDINEYLITKRSFGDKQQNILFIPVITLMYIQCSHCSAEYLSKYRFGAGLWPDKGLPEGKLSQMVIDEIVYIKGEKRVEELINRL